ncbi:MAG: hypothetical protein KGO96_13800, partial [Elusimicrobia bacterium]|nr:hypothetical protein [Elusimicrobiota bacterium]
YPPIPWNGQGQPMTPAGYSLPPGPSDAAGMTGDGTSTAMLNSALADRAKQAQGVQEASTMSPLMIGLMAGLALLVFKGGVGQGPLTRRRR